MSAVRFLNHGCLSGTLIPSRPWDILGNLVFNPGAGPVGS